MVQQSLLCIENMSCYVDFERLYGEGRQHYKHYAEYFACKLAERND